MVARPNHHISAPGASDDGLARAALDALNAPVCVLDGDGIIIATNHAWRRFGADNGGNAGLTGEGSNYLAACERYALVSSEGEVLYAQLREALAGRGAEFDFQYPCHGPGRRRWFTARVTPMPGTGRVLIAHIDVSAYRLAEIRAAAQAEVVTLIADHAPLSAILDAVLRGVEAENPDMLCSVLLLDDDGQALLHAAAPSLPAFYCEALHGLRIGPMVGSCGAAAWARSRVVVADIQNDARWQFHRDLAAQAGLKACWSEPLFSRSGALLGTFAIYQRECGAPSAADIATITGAARIAAVAIERVHDEVALKESEARFSNAFMHTAVGIALVGPDGRWMKVNRALCHMLGYSESELLKRGYAVLTHPDDLARTEMYANRLRQGEIESFQHEKRYVHRSGRAVWTLSSVSMVRGERGQPLYAVSQIHDITALKTAENERTLLFEFSPDLLCVADIDGRFKQVNPAWTRALGWTQEELLRLDAYLDLVHPDDREATLQQGRALFAGRPSLDFENRYLCKDGSYRLLSWNAFPLPQAGVTFAVVRDITERAAAESRRREQDEHLRQRQKLEALGSLAGGIAHDFNNLLAIILGNAGLAQRAPGGPQEVEDRLAQIELAARRATELVQQIMAFSRRQPRQLHLVALGAVVEEALRLLRATIPAGIDLHMHCDPDTPTVMADTTQMHQVVMNLCTNAWHALQGRPGHRGRITVRVARCSDVAAVRARVGADQLGPGPLVELVVEDDGDGMDGATLARIFEPFFTTRDTGEGTGLGLAVVHGIIAAHQGAITVDSTPGLGTTLRVYLPAVRGEQQTDTSAHVAPLHASPACRRPAQVLYVDDETQLVALAQALFEEAGHAFTGYSRATDALAALEADPARFDILVTDFNMPEYSGLDLARAVARSAPDLPVIIASGYVTPALQAEAGSCAVRRLLHKAELATTLVASVEAVLAETSRGAH